MTPGSVALNGVRRAVKTSRSRRHLKHIICCSLPNVTPHDKFHSNQMKSAEIQILEIFEIFDPPNFFERSAKAKLSKLERFSWSYWNRNYENY